MFHRNSDDDLYGQFLKDIVFQTYPIYESVVAARDQYVPKEDLAEFWSALASDKKLSHIIIQESEHKIPESKPERNSSWIADPTSGQLCVALSSDED